MPDTTQAAPIEALQARIKVLEEVCRECCIWATHPFGAPDGTHIGWHCEMCGDVITDDGDGHEKNCPLHGMAPWADPLDA